MGNDKVGILAQVCTACAEANVNVEEVTQRILRGTFAMIMLVDVSSCSMEDVYKRQGPSGRPLQ